MFSGRALGVVTKLWFLDFNYCQCNKDQWKNPRTFLKLLGTITSACYFHLFICLVINF